jgi:hypothetical protein
MVAGGHDADVDAEGTNADADAEGTDAEADADGQVCSVTNNQGRESN